jgi:hypothetical protein
MGPVKQACHFEPATLTSPGAPHPSPSGRAKGVARPLTFTRIFFMERVFPKKETEDGIADPDPYPQILSPKQYLNNLNFFDFILFSGPIFVGKE